MISTVIPVPGWIALKAVRIAQFRKSVPPQVQVTARYPGAGAEVVELTDVDPGWAA